ncbi:hypothetical protein UWK_03578 (plasmid) [Desulfocapsa sulfexigens DSM 10523]|uniref:Uncharacterized protein n=1 Tax=Desulfocapsa sulfexigens (strain DSM 10523 / SB164P1) TaxID=1167006 RepID=M1PEW4_DESSD|nr:hypothetical protein [Desulfocapsa sulfexigens]AGF80087.1 hypothetical protein UWK_03578 [Desulfocapsa sulfexigens DSM 10523]
MNPIKKRIINFLAGEESIPLEAFQAYLDKSKELVSVGIENDADILLYAHKTNGKVFVVGLVGKSIINGPELNSFLELYFADSGGLASHAKGIAEYIYKDLATATEGFMVFRCAEDSRWRSFKPIKNAELIKGRTLHG